MHGEILLQGSIINDNIPGFRLIKSYWLNRNNITFLYKGMHTVSLDLHQDRLTLPQLLNKYFPNAKAKAFGYIPIYV